MKAPKTMQELKIIALSITSPITICTYLNKKKATFTPVYTDTLEGKYCMYNGVIIFIYEKVFYVIPYMRTVMNILKENDFIFHKMDVPFSNGDYPAELKAHWEMLLTMAVEQSKLDFITDCEVYSDLCNFSQISKSLLDKCFEIPSTGVHVSTKYGESIYYPLIGTSLDSVTTSRIGHFCIKNATCVFVYRNGKTYVTQNWEVVDALSQSGYVLGDLFVPFADGETIVEPKYAAKWKNISASA